MVLVNFRGSSRNSLGNLLARFLPFRPCVFRGTLGFSRTSRSVNFPIHESPSLVFRRHLSVLRPSLPPSLMSRIDMEPSKKAPRLSSRVLQHIRICSPSFHSSFEQRLKSFAPLFRSPVLRVWLPSRRCQVTTSLKASFSSQRSWT